MPHREAAPVAETPAVARRVEGVVPHRETAPVAEAPAVEQRVEGVVPHREAAPVAEAPAVARRVEGVVPHREAAPVAEAPAVDGRRDANIAPRRTENVDMKIESITFELRGNPPVKVQLVSSAGLAPLPVPGLASRFKVAMEEESAAGARDVPLVHNPFVAPPALDAHVAAQSASFVVSAASARTEAIVETVNEIVETVVDRISVTSTLAQGNGEIRITLRPSVLDGSTINLTAADGELTVAVAPSTPEAARVAAAALPRLEIALAEHAPAFRHVAVVLAATKKGKANETV